MEKPNQKEQIAARVEPDIKAAVERIATNEDRTVSNTIERLIKTHPDVLREVAESGAQAETTSA